MRSGRLIWLIFVIVMILLYLYLYSTSTAMLQRFYVRPNGKSEGKGGGMRTQDVIWLVIVIALVVLWLVLTFPSEVSTLLTILAH